MLASSSCLKRNIVMKNDRYNLHYWLALWHVPGIGPKSFARAIASYPHLQDLFSCTGAQLKQLGFNEKSIAHIRQPNWQQIEREIHWSTQPQQHIVTWNDSNYPKLLKEISSSPPILYVKGDVNVLNSQQLAMVGSRHPTPTGKETAAKFSKALSLLGLTITSGLAYGIDITSHRACLQTTGKTIAVMGCGIDCIYPKRHAHIAAEIVERGALVSEYPLGLLPIAKNFPRRNRIISGLSLGVLVIEAALKSGSLITAHYALEQNREVFAIPSSIHNSLAKGCHALIREGGVLVETIQHIIEQLPFELSLQSRQMQASETPPDAKKSHILDINQKKLMTCVGFELTPIDTMVERSGFSVSKISAMLPMLELQGVIRSIPGGYMRV